MNGGSIGSAGITSAGRAFVLNVMVRNPGDAEARAEAALAVPAGWELDVPRRAICLPVGGEGVVIFQVVPRGPPTRRARVAADVTIDGRPLGQQAEALVSTITSG